MKLLVLAQTPPPQHGQSLMVQALLDGLPARGIAVAHANLRLSRNAADIGRWRPGKLTAVLSACRTARALAREKNFDAIYYVPAPGKRGALYRDWLAMRLCRRLAPRLIFHWHASGMSEWLQTRATAAERAITLRLLGHADLSLVLAESLRQDADFLHANRVSVVPNGIADPCPAWKASTRETAVPFQVLFLGLCSEEKGLFRAVDAVLAANRSPGASSNQPGFVLTAAGSFPDVATASRFQALMQSHPGVLQHAGFVEGAAKSALFARSHCLCFPTQYPAEGQPLAVIEALAHDLPVVTFRWRAIPEMLPSTHTWCVEPHDPAALPAALVSARQAGSANGKLRQHFLTHFTLQRHLDTLAAALRAAP